MRVRHLIVAAAASVAFAVTPALAKQVLVRGAPEFPRGTTAEGAQHESTATFKTTLSGSSATTEYFSCGPAGDYRIWGTVTFDEPPLRIDLETEESRIVTLKARADLSGAGSGGTGDRGLTFWYSAERAFGRNFSDGRLSLRSRQFEEVGMRTNCRGSESRHWEGDLKQEIAAVLHVAPRQTSGFAIWVTVQAAGGQLQVRYPYTLEEEPDEPEVAAGDSDAVGDAARWLDLARAYQQVMDRMQADEEALLQERTRLLAAADAMADPIWTGDRFDQVRIEPGEDVAGRVDTLILLVELLGVDEAILARLPREVRIVIAIGGGLSAFRDRGRDAIMQTIRTRSDAARQQILASFEQELDIILEIFEFARRQRDEARTMAERN